MRIVVLLLLVSGCGGSGLFGGSCVEDPGDLDGTWLLEFEKVSGNCFFAESAEVTYPDGTGVGLLDFRPLIESRCGGGYVDSGSDGDGLSWSVEVSNARADDGRIDADMRLESSHERGGSCSGEFMVTATKQG